MFCKAYRIFVAFNRPIPTKTVVIYENPEKTIADLATLLNLPAKFTSKVNNLVNSSQLSFVNKFTIVIKNRYTHS